VILSAHIWCLSVRLESIVRGPFYGKCRRYRPMARKATTLSWSVSWRGIKLPCSNLNIQTDLYISLFSYCFHGVLGFWYYKQNCSYDFKTVEEIVGLRGAILIVVDHIGPYKDTCYKGAYSLDGSIQLSQAQEEWWWAFCYSTQTPISKVLSYRRNWLETHHWLC